MMGISYKQIFIFLNLKMKTSQITPTVIMTIPWKEFMEKLLPTYIIPTLRHISHHRYLYEISIRLL